MAKTKMPRDDNNQSIPALRPSVARVGVTAGAAAVRVGPFTTGCKVISLYCRTAVLRFQTGDGSVVATGTSHYIAIGERMVISLGAAEDVHTHISVIRDGAADGTLEISELE